MKRFYIQVRLYQVGNTSSRKNSEIKQLGEAEKRGLQYMLLGQKKKNSIHSSTKFHKCEKDFTLPNPTGNKEEGNSHNSRETGPPKKYLRRHKIIHTST